MFYYIKNMGDFYTLALSGGGYKGLFSAHVLSRLEKELGCPVAQKFDLLSGTSIGGIIAIALALEIPAGDIERLFLEKGKKIFKKRTFISTGLILMSKYSNSGLKEVLGELFEDKIIADLKHRVIIPAINYTEGKPQVFKTPHNPKLKNDKNLKLVDVALATSAAPTYFPVFSSNAGDFVDGGLMANHPGYFAVVEAMSYLNQPLENIHQLHIGTISQKFTSSSSKYVLGSSFWSWKENIFNLMFSCQEQSAENLLHFYLKDRYVSIDSVAADEQAKQIKLDKINKKSSRILIQKADDAVKCYLGNLECFNKLKKHQPGEYVPNN